MLKKDIDYKKRIAIGLVLAVVRLVFANSQMMLIFPFSAPLDDDLYFSWAQSLAAGNWLGEYNYLTLSKYPFFGFYLAALHKLGIPYIVGNCLMWISLALLCVMAFSPVLKSNWHRLILFAAVIYNPSTYAEHNLRVYRDSIFPILCTMFFVALAGWALRLKGKISRSTPYIVIAGIALGCTWVCREDGFWLLPFGIAAIAICIIYIIIDKELKNKAVRIALSTVPAVITVCIVLTVCSINNKYYGVFTLSDFDDGSFAECFGGMTTLSHKDWHPLISVPEDVRMRMYEDCPTFEQFYQYLDRPDSRIKYGYSTASLGDYKSGQLYWAIRRSANEMGYYSSAGTARQLWAQLAAEVESMRLADKDALPHRASLTPPIKMEYVPLVLEEAMNSIRTILTWQQMRCYEDTVSDITTGQIQVWEDFLHEQSNYMAMENSDHAYYTPFQWRCFKTMNGITCIYRAFTVPLLLLGLWFVAKGFIRFKHQSFEKQIMLFVLPGMLAMGLFRIFIISFMEVAAFDIGTYAMYLGAAYPVLVLFCVLGLCLADKKAN